MAKKSNVGFWLGAAAVAVARSQSWIDDTYVALAICIAVLGGWFGVMMGAGIAPIIRPDLVGDPAEHWLYERMCLGMWLGFGLGLVAAVQGWD